MNMQNPNDTILTVRQLSTVFDIAGQEATAVDKLSFTLKRGQVLGLVGESGCGKSVSSLSIMRLIDRPGRIKSGQIIYHNVPSNLEDQNRQDEQDSQAEALDLLKCSDQRMRQIRGKHIAMIFQEPMTSLNPVYTVGYQIMEAILLHQKVSKKEARNRAIEMLKKVKIPDPEKRIDDYPHQLSGGMRQRVMIAMALSCEPDILIADEPTTALDVTVQAQILDLILELVDETQMSVLLITHDFGVVAEVCDEVLVMYAGKMVEYSPVERLLRKPKHPYTQALLKSIPHWDQKESELYSIPGRVPDIKNLPLGCRFAERCSQWSDACFKRMPPMKYVGEGQYLRCLNY